MLKYVLTQKGLNAKKGADFSLVIRESTFSEIDFLLNKNCWYSPQQPLSESHTTGALFFSMCVVRYAVTSWTP